MATKKDGATLDVAALASMAVDGAPAADLRPGALATALTDLEGAGRREMDAALGGGLPDAATLPPTALLAVNHLLKGMEAAVRDARAALTGEYAARDRRKQIDSAIAGLAPDVIAAIRADGR